MKKPKMPGRNAGLQTLKRYEQRLKDYEAYIKLKRRLQQKRSSL
jgi:hypothetical protein